MDDDLGAWRSITALGLVGAALATGCGGGKSAGEIAQGLKKAIEASQPEARYAGEARVKAKTATCSALEGYSSDPAQALTDRLKAEAAAQQLRRDLGLTEVDPTLPQRLIDAADEIDGTQQASEVVSKLGC